MHIHTKTLMQKSLCNESGPLTVFFHRWGTVIMSLELSISVFSGVSSHPYLSPILICVPINTCECISCAVNWPEEFSNNWYFCIFSYCSSLANIHVGFFSSSSFIKPSAFSFSLCCLYLVVMEWLVCLNDSKSYGENNINTGKVSNVGQFKG